MEEILNAEEVRNLLGIGKHKLTLLCKQGLPHIKLGKTRKTITRVFLRRSLIDYLKSLEQPKLPEPEVKPKEKPKLAQPQRQ
jgi:hypothetical protein